MVFITKPRPSIIFWNFIEISLLFFWIKECISEIKESVFVCSKKWAMVVAAAEEEEGDEEEEGEGVTEQ